MECPTFSITAAVRQILGTQEFDTITDGTGNDTIEGYRRGDVIDGGAGNDEQRAGKGHDTVLGREGNDTVYTGMGDDLITTGAGADMIILSSRDLGFDFAAGNKTVTDFSVAEDRLGFDGVDAITWARLNSGETGFGISANTDGDAVITWVSDHGFGGMVTLQGVSVGQVTAVLFV